MVAPIWASKLFFRVAVFGVCLSSIFLGCLACTWMQEIHCVISFLFFPMNWWARAHPFPFAWAVGRLVYADPDDSSWGLRNFLTVQKSFALLEDRDVDSQFFRIDGRCCGPALGVLKSLIIQFVIIWVMGKNRWLWKYHRYELCTINGIQWSCLSDCLLWCYRMFVFASDVVFQFMIPEPWYIQKIQKAMAMISSCFADL